MTSGNARPLPVLKGLAIHLFNKLQWANRKFLPRFLLINGGRSYPSIEGRLDGRTPKETLDLQPGELVEVKSKEEIFATLDRTGHNRGLRFDIEMLRYCGKRARVQRRVNRLIDEKTGKMVHIGGDCIVLDGFICAADFHQNCPARHRGVLAGDLAASGSDPALNVQRCCSHEYVSRLISLADRRP